MLEKLQVFCVLAECGSFTETARRMYCSQPTVSHQISQLEQKYETKLILRTNRKVLLTSAGEKLLKYAKHVLAVYEQMEQKMALEDTPLSIYISCYIAENYFEAIMPAHSFGCPCEIKSNCYKELKAALLNEETGFAVMPVYEQDEAVQKAFGKQILFEEELLLAMSLEHPLASRKILYARDLADQAILIPDSFFLQELVKGQLKERGIKARYIQMTNFEIMKQAVCQNIGLAFLPKKLIEKDQTGKLSAKPISGFTVKRQHALYTNPGKELSPDEQSICRYIKDQFRAYESPSGKEACPAGM